MMEAYILKFFYKAHNFSLPTFYGTRLQSASII
jgi:hypothetical protein